MRLSPLAFLASGGEVAAAYEAVLGRAPDAAGLQFYTNSGLSAGEVAAQLAGSREGQVQAAYQSTLGRGADVAGRDFYTTGAGSSLSGADLLSALSGSREAQANAAALASYTGGAGGAGASSGAGGLGGRSATEIITQLYQDQLGRAPDAAGLREYSNALNSGQKTIAQIANELDRTTDGFNYDQENVVAAYRRAFGRNPDQAGLQYWMGKEDAELNISQKLSDYIKGGAKGADVQAIAQNPTGFLSFVSEALRSDPWAGMYAVDNPYYFGEDMAKVIAEAKGSPNVSRTAAGQYVQFVNPITEQPAYSGYTPDGQFKVFAGNHTLQADRVRQAVNLNRQSGTLTEADANRILTAISSPEKFRQVTGTNDPKANTLYALLSDPKATVMVNSLGIQVGEDANASLAQAEVAARQRIVDRAAEVTGGNVNPSTVTQEQVAQELGIKFPFTTYNMSTDPLTGKPIRTKMTGADVVNNLFTQLKIPIDTKLKNIFTEGLGFEDQFGPGVDSGVAPGGGRPIAPADVVGTTGDFRGLAFPQERPTTVGETPAMLGFQPYSLTQPGSGQQKLTEPQPVIPVPNATAPDPVTSGLLGAAIGTMLPGSQSNVESGLTNIAQGIASVIKPTTTYNENTAVQQTPDTYYTPTTRNILSEDSSSYYKSGGMATPLMKEGGMVKHFADGGFSQIASGIGEIFSSTPVRGALFGALISNLLNAQAKAQAESAYRGVDMSKVGVIPPRTTQVGPVRFAPYRQYASLPEIPSTVSSPINVGALRSSQTPMTSFTPTQGMVNPLTRPLSTIYPTPMADGGAAYYTYGQQVDPMDYLRGMAQGGMAHGGLHGAQHTYDVPTVEGRKDYRQGAAVTGPGDGQSDDIPAMLADGEYVFDADTVAQLGNGSTKAGSQMLDKFREEIRQHKRSAPVNKIPPPSKSPLAYLAAAQKKSKGARRV